MKAPLLSIIVPMYNVAEYLPRCIESLAEQDLSFEEYEIICVNDGSPDNCSEIVRELQKRVPNITLLEQENQGVSVARNNAMAIAKGKYIMMIDADDYIKENSLLRIVSLAEKIEYDILYLGLIDFSFEGKTMYTTQYTPLENKIFDGIEGYFASRGTQVQLPDRSAGILFRKKLLYDFQISYPKDVPYLEDGVFLGKVFVVAKKVAFDNADFYQRMNREDSATNSNVFFSQKAIDGFLHAVKNIKEFDDEHYFTKEQKGLINHLIAKYVLLTVTPSISKYNYREYSAIIKKLEKVNVDKVNVNGLRFLYRRHMLAFNFSTTFFPFYLKIYNKFMSNVFR